MPTRLHGSTVALSADSRGPFLDLHASIQPRSSSRSGLFSLSRVVEGSFKLEQPACLPGKSQVTLAQ